VFAGRSADGEEGMPLLTVRKGLRESWRRQEHIQLWIRDKDDQILSAKMPRKSLGGHSALRRVGQFSDESQRRRWRKHDQSGSRQTTAVQL